MGTASLMFQSTLLGLQSRFGDDLRTILILEILLVCPPIVLVSGTNYSPHESTNLFRTAVSPVPGTNYIESNWFVSKTGRHFLKKGQEQVFLTFEVFLSRKKLSASSHA